MTKRSLKRILLVEDDTDIQEVTTLLLSHMGDFEVQACGTAAEALQAAQAFDPDLILLDVMMPGLDGHGAFEAFRQMPATAMTPVIFMTARVQPHEIMEYRQLGSLGVIAKPFDPDTLADTIKGMWDGHQNSRMNETRAEDFAALRAHYAADLPERLLAIEKAASSLRDNGWDNRVAGSLDEMAHRLAGSAAIYGFPLVSEAAKRVADFSNKRAPGRFGPADAGPLIELVAALSAALQRSAEPKESRPGFPAP